MPVELSPGDLIGGRYRLIDVIGSGAMGSVWAAENELTRGRFALKVMKPEAALDPTAVQRFLQEARTAGGLRHPSIIEVYDVGHHPQGKGGPKLPFLVMQLLEGETLEQVLAREQRLTPVEVIRLLHCIAQGLAVAHDAGIVHRDLKPANLFFHVEEGVKRPLILDFGISKLLGVGASDGVLTVAGLVLGSPPYMSPEQAGGKLDVDARTDVWALGVIAYRALSGQLPFGAPNYNALMLEIIGAAPRPIDELCPTLNPALANLVMTCLSKDRALRPRDARALEQQLAALLASDTHAAFSQVTEAATSRPKVRATWVVGLASLALTAAGFFVFRGRETPTAQHEPTTTRVAPMPPSLIPAAELVPAAPHPALPPPSASIIPSASKVVNPPRPKLAGPKPAPARVSAKPARPPAGPPPVNEGVTSPGL